MTLAFVLAILFALSVATTRKVRDRLARRRREALPGYAIDRPLLASSYDDVDAFLASARCVACGKGRLLKLGEGTLRGQGFTALPTPITALRTECMRCEERVTLFVDVTEVPN